MKLVKCPKCGEKYADSYGVCPFCTEDEEFFNGNKARKMTRRVEKHKTPSILGPALVVVVLLLAGFLVYSFFGGRIAEKIKEKKDAQTEQADPQPQPQPQQEKLALDRETLTLTEGESGKLTATGESVTWISSDESVATVSADGTVSAVKAGEATITATTTEESAACTVTVKAKAEPEPEKKPVKNKKLAIATIYGSLPKNDRGHWEFTASVGDDSFYMKVTGTKSEVTWTSSDKSVAKVSKGGKFTAVDSGKATLTASVDGQKLKCDVIIN